MARPLRDSASPNSRQPESVPPCPADLIESLRDFGYTLPSALADLIDNSLASQAAKVRVIVEPTTPAPHIAILDDGHGMAEARLIEAMRMGSLGPLAPRGQSDLGRFGLGMKTASLSQGRCLTVITKQQGDRHTSVRRWDLAHVRRVADWQLLAEPTELSGRYARTIEAARHGTAVVIEQLDRAAFLNLPEPALASSLATTLDGIRRHLGMVFHRFISEDGFEIRLGETAIQPWDPYLSDLSTRLPSERLKLPGNEGAIEVTPFVLPHHSHLSDDQHDYIAGPHGWNAHQGFYIYRCRRLIVPGTWLNLKLRKEEHYKLARIRVDLPNTMDSSWHLNVMKSHVAPPASLWDDFKRIASDVRRQASDVYRLRGERQAPSQERPDHFMWRRQSTRTGVRYTIDRSHPVLRALLHTGCPHEQLLGEVLSLIESTVPVASMLQEPQKTLDGSVQAEPPVDLESLISMVFHAEQYFIRTGKKPTDARNLVLSCEPFVRFREGILDRLRERRNSSQPNGES